MEAEYLYKYLKKEIKIGQKGRIRSIVRLHRSWI